MSTKYQLSAEIRQSRVSFNIKIIISMLGLLIGCIDRHAKHSWTNYQNIELGRHSSIISRHLMLNFIFSKLLCCLAFNIALWISCMILSESNSIWSTRHAMWNMSVYILQLPQIYSGAWRQYRPKASGLTHYVPSAKTE